MAPLAFILSYPDLRFPIRWAQSRRAPLWKTLNVSDLTAQLDRLVRAGRPTVTISDILAALAGRRVLPPHAVALTFDGGLAVHYSMVLPLLRARGLVATFLIPAGPLLSGRMNTRHKIQAILAHADSIRDVLSAIFDLVADYRPGEKGRPRLPLPPPESASDWDEQAARGPSFINRLLRSGLPDALRTQAVDRLFQTFVGVSEAAFAARYYLSPGQIAGLIDNGMEIGGNAMGAIDLQGLPPAAQESEIAGTARFLRETLVLTGDLIFSYPQGGWDEVTLDLLPRHGFSGGLTTHAGPVLPGADRYRLPRIDIGITAPEHLPF